MHFLHHLYNRVGGGEGVVVNFSVIHKDRIR